MEKIVLLPGASGNIHFWTPLIEHLPHKYQKEVIAYPGFGLYPTNNNINSFHDLQNYVLGHIKTESIVIAQSMGGIFAVSAALQKTEFIRGLVLIATSGGIDLTPFHVEDWRKEYQNQYPQYPDWFMQTQVNYEDQLEKINVPILLIWGSDDPISPVAVGTYLYRKFKNAQLTIIQGGKHDLAEKHTEEVASYIHQFLESLATMD